MMFLLQRHLIEKLALTKKPTPERSPPRGTARVHPSQGITVHYLSYWHDVFRLPDVARTRVPVRYDPFDLSVAYAYVHERWVECVTSSYGQFQGHSERELLLATAELRA